MSIIVLLYGTYLKKILKIDFYLFSATETYDSGTMNVYGLPSGQSLDRRNMTLASSSGHITAAVLGQSINLHSALSLGYYCLNINPQPSLHLVFR